jgi:hypothetical protein
MPSILASSLVKSVGSNNWPSEDEWKLLRNQVNGRLTRTALPWIDGKLGIFNSLKNPFWNEEQPGSLQSSGWFDAWTAVASPYAVKARTTNDISAAVNFARENNVKLVVKGTGHDYLGRNCAPHSLLVWTHEMREVTMHDSFIPDGAPSGTEPVHAMTVEAGTRWLEAYMAATKAGRYVQGGGCTSVGACGGFTFGSGFGSFSKRFGTGSGGILQAEIVTADGMVHIVNEYQKPDLFYGVRGGGGGTFGIVSQVTLLTHLIPRTFGVITGEVKAKSDFAYRELLRRFVEFYLVGLDNPWWGESVSIGPDNVLGFRLVFLDKSKTDAEETMALFFDELHERASDFIVAPEYQVAAFDQLWNPDFWDASRPGFITRDVREEAPGDQYWWTGNQSEVSVYWNSYQSRWIPTDVIRDNAGGLSKAFFDASRLTDYIFQINKGLSGEHPEARARDENTALHPGCYGAAALVIMGKSQQYKYEGVPGKKPDMELARKTSADIAKAMDFIRRVTPLAGSYANEADFFLENWQNSQWGSNYPKLLRIKRKYDPNNFFTVHHGVGSEEL